jgi:hypothetical protein
MTARRFLPAVGLHFLKDALCLRISLYLLEELILLALIERSNACEKL